MGKVVERVKLTSLFEPEKSVEVDAIIDTGATMVVLPRDIVEELGLRKMREVKVRYANNKVETKPIYGVVNIELKGRSANLDVLVEEKGSQPLIGQVLLELLDLIVEPKTRNLIPNPASPEMPMMEILMTTVYNRRICGSLAKISQGETSHIPPLYDIPPRSLENEKKVNKFESLSYNKRWLT